MSGDRTRSRVPAGFKLRHVLRGHKAEITRIAWSPDGRFLASPSHDRTIRIWDAQTGKLVHTLEAEHNTILCVAWSPDGRTLASASADFTLRLWNTATWQPSHVLRGHFNSALSLTWSSTSLSLGSGSVDRTVRIWDCATGELRNTLKGHTSTVNSVAWRPEKRTLASGSDDGVVRVWDTATGQVEQTFVGHTDWVLCVAWSPDGRTVGSGSADKTVHLWDMVTGREVSVLEGHTSSVGEIAFSSDGRILASKSWDNTVRLWRSDTWEIVTFLDEPASGQWPPGLAFHPKAPVLATLGEADTVVRIWDLDTQALLSRGRGSAILVHAATAKSPEPEVEEIEIASGQYKNAKVVMVGDTGVGKTGLGLVLTGQPFAPTESTHGRHVWTLEKKEVELGGGRRETRETLLWDLAGQPGYRLIHQLHLKEVAVALVVFDARSESDPFAGVRHWQRALRQAQRVQGEHAPPMKKVLVAARADRGGIVVSRARIETLVADLGFDEYFETSAKEGWCIEDLAATIRQAIDWDAVPKVSSTKLFERIKAFLMEQKTSGCLLSTADELFRAFLRSAKIASEPRDLRAQFDTCIGRVESRGLIRRLSFGGLVLLQPELVDAYASAMINAAKSEPDGLGSLGEEDAREGRFRMPQAERIKDKKQEKLLLIATVEDMMRHEVVLREPAEDGPHLVFPSEFSREYPDLPGPEGQDAVFLFEGPLLHIYATLAVRLAHSGAFKKQGMWKNAATYTATAGGTCGMLLHEIEEGRGELTLFYDKAASAETRFQFEEYVHAHLRRRALPETIRRRRVFVCSECRTPVSDMQVERRRERGFDWIRCSVCDARVSLSEREERAAAARPATGVTEMDSAADLQRELDAGLVSAMAEMQMQGFRQWVGGSKATLALVFTDIVGSTTLCNELGNQRMNEVRRAHFRQARFLLRKHGGYEIKTIGDSLMVAFRTAAEAFDWAVSLHTDTGDERVKIRAGIDVGPVEIEEEDAFGAMVNYAAQVVCQAKGAEIRVSNQAKNHIDQQRAKDDTEMLWTVHPECEIKGFSGKHVLWSVAVSAPPPKQASESA